MKNIPQRLLAAWLSWTFVLPSSAATPDAAAASRDLSGLWQAERRFGPALRGPISIEQVGTEWRAGIDGRTATAQAAADTVNCDFGSKRGRLRLAIDPAGAPASAWWIQPRNFQDGGGHATPVPLTRIGKAEWRGTVTPLEDRVTMYLPLAATPTAGSYSTFLRNPERNLGVFLNITRLTVDGERVTLYSRRKDADPETAYVTGRYDREDETFSFYLPRANGSYDFHRVKAGEASDFYPRGFPTAPYAYEPPRARDDGWQVSTLDQEGISRETIETFIRKLIDTPMDSVHASEIHGVLIARHGRLVLEEYFHGISRDQLHSLRSASKSFTATLAGAVVQRRLGGFSVDTPVYEAMKSRVAPGPLEPRKQAMKVEHLLTMSAGFFCDDGNDAAPGNEDRMQDQQDELDWYRYTLAVPMATDPGTVPVYCSAEPNLLGGVMAVKTGRPLAELFRTLVAEPLDMKHYALNLQPNGEPYMGGGMQVTLRDFLKFAELMMDGGTWNGRRIVSREWCERATSPLVHIGKSPYGYLWWIDEYDYQGRKLKAFHAGGNGGQVAIAVPELDLAIGFLGGNYADRVLFIPQRDYVPQDILSAVN
ncbi:MAG TPA: serine hydrolase domain-containing protein [Steroidobacteraceae bacterium]|nr:serine hydrolase domain-containing protein [Steroidobacteraceae bacterium]